MLLTTHYMEEAEALCDRVGVIQDGRLLALDTIANLRADHGFEYKIVYESDDRTHTVYGADDRSLVRQAQSDGIREYSVSTDDPRGRLPGTDRRRGTNHR